MAHAIWSGAVNFGLVSIPVKLFTAVREQQLHFHMLHDKDHGRIQNIRRCNECGKDVKWDDLVRGYEYEKGQYVVMSDEDFKSVNVEATQSVDIVEFVDLVEINPMLFDKPYYLEPEKKGRHAYALLRDALKKSGKVGIARVVLRSREHIAAVKPQGDALVLEMMHYADEIAATDEFSLPPENEKTPANEMKMALMLIDTMASTFDPTVFKDGYRDQLLALIEARAKNRPVSKSRAKLPARNNVVDLMEVLQRSLDESKKPAGEGPSVHRAKRRKEAKEGAEPKKRRGSAS